MKKLCALILALILFSSAALAESIDLSGMSFDELLDLQARVNDALWAADGWKHVKIPAGYYEVGVEIPAGRWTISPADSSIFFAFYESLDEALEDGYSVYAAALFDDDTYSVIIKDGMGLELAGAAYFTTYAPSFSFD